MKAGRRRRRGVARRRAHIRAAAPAWRPVAAQGCLARACPGGGAHGRAHALVRLTRSWRRDGDFVLLREKGGEGQGGARCMRRRGWPQGAPAPRAAPDHNAAFSVFMLFCSLVSFFLFSPNLACCVCVLPFAAGPACTEQCGRYGACRGEEAKSPRARMARRHRDLQPHKNFFQVLMRVVFFFSFRVLVLVLVQRSAAMSSPNKKVKLKDKAKGTPLRSASRVDNLQVRVCCCCSVVVVLFVRCFPFLFFSFFFPHSF